MSSLGPLLGIGVVAGALCLIIGAKQIGTKLIVGSIVIAVLLPVALCVIGQVPVSLAPLASIVGWVLRGIVLVAVMAGWLAYVKQRRALKKWREPDEPTQSLKRRIDPE